MMAAGFDFETLLTRGLEAEDLYGEVGKIIAEMRDENARLGGDDRAFGLMVCGWLGLTTLPCFEVGSQ